MQELLYKADDLTFSYRAGTPVLSGIDFRLSRGELACVIGPNGSGKSTLLKLLAGLLKPQGGKILFNGRPVKSIPPRDLARMVSYLPQDDEIHFPFSVGEVVILGRWPHSGGAFFDSAKDRHAAESAMKKVGIITWAGRSITELSGGERARVSLARALATEPECLLLDEPASELDLKHGAETYALLRHIASDGAGVLVAAHDMGSVSRWADRVILLSDGKIRADDSPEKVLTESILSEVFSADIKVMADGNDRAIFVKNGRDGGV